MAEGKKMSFLQRLRMKRGQEADQDLREAHILAYACGRVARAAAKGLAKVGAMDEETADKIGAGVTKAVDGFIRRFASGKVAEDIHQRSERYGQKIISLTYGQSLNDYKALEKQVKMGASFALASKNAGQIFSGLRGAASGGMGA